MVAIKSNDTIPVSFNVYRQLIRFYCPGQALSEASIAVDAKRDVVRLLFHWLYTGTIGSDDWRDVIELYLLASSMESIALKRSAVSHLQRVCRHDALEKTGLIHYEHMDVVRNMVGESSPLFRYIQDTYFQHWTESEDPPDDVPDTFFRKLFARTRRESPEEHCSCCHDFCKYHEHEGEEEHMASESTLTSTQQQRNGIRNGIRLDNPVDEVSDPTTQSPVDWAISGPVRFLCCYVYVTKAI